MPSNPLLSVGQLIDNSWELFRSKMVEYLSVSSWLLVTAILHVIALAFYPSVSKLQLNADLTNLEIFGMYLYALTFYIIAPIFAFWILASMTRMVRMHLSRRKLDHVQALKEGRDIFFPTLVTTAMVILMLILALVIGFAPSAILAGLGSWLNLGVLTVIASILLLIGVFVSCYLSVQWMGYYFFGPVATIFDNKRGKAALETSRNLVEGRFWAVLARIVVPKLVFMLFGVFLMYIIAMVTSIVIDTVAGLNLDLFLRLTTIVDTVIPIVIVILINPLVIISDVLLFQSLKESR